MKVNHLAIIMDGNRRWAEKRNLPVFEGHRQGLQTLKEVVKACPTLEIKYLTVFAFSTENKNRSENEVKFLLSLMKEALKNELQELHGQNVKLRFLGDLEFFGEELSSYLKDAEALTEKNNGLNLQVAINYGGRAEIIKAIKNISKEALEGQIGEAGIEKIDEELVGEYLWTQGIPDPDLLIRTGNEFRISNFLLWQCAYSELSFCPVLWPDFDRKTLESCLDDFRERNRRFGK